MEQEKEGMSVPFCGLYILVGQTPVRCDDLLEWGRQFEGDRHVAKTHVGEVFISTVFLGTDHSFGLGGPLLLFETMVFGGPLNLEQWRCSTWLEAEEQHRAAVELVQAQTDARRGLDTSDPEAMK